MFCETGYKGAMSLHVERTGSGRRVLFIQGVGVAGCGWSPQVEALHGDLAWFDNRGIGASPGKPGSVEDMARDALDVMDGLGWADALLVGHSLGGVIAQQVAVLAPERVTGLALLCTFAQGSAAISLAPRDMWLNMRTVIGTASMRRTAFFELVTDPSLPSTEENMGALEKVFGRKLSALPPAARAQVMALSRADLRASITDFSGPRLVLSATHDRVAPIGQGRALAAVLQTPLVEVPGGHAVTVQEASLVNRYLADFIG
jgi:3-oxoadipate enol-lactonase